nr:hypothetical protein [uncultured Desulfuromonas sp.]
MIAGGDSGDGFSQTITADIVSKGPAAPGTIKGSDSVEVVVGECLVFRRIKFIVDGGGIAASPTGTGLE